MALSGSHITLQIAQFVQLGSFARKPQYARIGLLEAPPGSVERSRARGEKYG